jgi:hypothetical protein
MHPDRNRATLVLIHSPLVGPLTWQATADVLRAAGWRVLVPSLAGVIDGGPPYHLRLAACVADAASDEPGPLVLVGHSGAGAILPSIAAARGARDTAHLYVDATLPRPGQSWFETVPDELRQRLESLAEDGMLPPWHSWFPSDAVAALLPDAELRERFFSDNPRLPLAYFAEPAPSVQRAVERSAYLQLDRAYQALADEAEARGWPVVRERADHLAMLTRPELVADRLHTLLERMQAT